VTAALLVDAALSAAVRQLCKAKLNTCMMLWQEGRGSNNFFSSSARTSSIVTHSGGDRLAAMLAAALARGLPSALFCCRSAATATTAVNMDWKLGIISRSTMASCATLEAREADNLSKSPECNVCAQLASLTNKL
jgi:hypothetical protein